MEADKKLVEFVMVGFEPSTEIDGKNVGFAGIWF